MHYVKKYPEDFSKPLLAMQDVLATANVVFFNNDMSCFTRNWRYLYLIPFMVGHFVTSSVPIMRELIEGRDLYEFLSFPVFIIGIQSILKLFIILSNKQRLENIIDELGRVWRADDLNEKQKIVRKAKAKELRIGVIAYLRLPSIVSWQYLLLPLAETVVFNVILGETNEKLLPIIAEYPFDPISNWLVYGVSYAYQVYCIFVISHIFLGSDFMVIALSAHLSREFLLLREDLTNIQPTKLASCARDHADIFNFVRSHQKLIILTEELDAAINKLMFVNVLFTTLNVSFFGLAAMVTKKMADRLINIIIVLTVLILKLILCYFGEKLKTASEEIFQAACENQWYEGDKDYKKIVYFIMLRSQRPCYVTSLKYTKITLQTFTKVLSTTWTYFSLVNTMYQHRK